MSKRSGAEPGGREAEGNRRERETPAGTHDGSEAPAGKHGTRETTPLPTGAGPSPSLEETGAAGTERRSASSPGQGGAGPAASTDTESPLRTEIATLTDRLVRARADYDNLQKRVARDAAQERDRAKARALEGLLPVLELAQMAAHQAESHPGPVSEGVILLAREFRRALEREGLVPFGAPGESFDPTRHEALVQEDVPGIAPGCVSRVIQTGYLLEGKVLRYAKVAVSPKKGAETVAGVPI